MKINRNRLECSMARKGLTVADIQRLAPISGTTFAKLRRGEEIRPDVAGKLAKVLDTQIENLTEVI